MNIIDLTPETLRPFNMAEFRTGDEDERPIIAGGTLVTLNARPLKGLDRVVAAFERQKWQRVIASLKVPCSRSRRTAGGL